MRVVVVGAGAIGAPIAARLFDRGSPTLLVARGVNFEAIALDGLSISTPEGTTVSRVEVINGIREIACREGDVVVLCVKSQDSRQALSDLASVVPASTPIFCAQNGVANERMALERFTNVYGVCVISPASYLEPGKVEIFSSPVIGVLDVGRWPRGVDNVAVELSSLLVDAGFASRVTDAIETLKWGKLLSNILNSLEALSGPDSLSDEVAIEARDEAVRCLSAHGVDVAQAESMMHERSKLISYHSIGGSSRVGSSTWQSVLRQTGEIESDFLNGEIVELGRRYAIPTPVNALLQRRGNELARQRKAPGSVSLNELRASLER